jgi:hypothetical protein
VAPTTEPEPGVLAGRQEAGVPNDVVPRGEGDAAVAPRAELGAADPRDTNGRGDVERVVVNAVLLGLALLFLTRGLLDLMR